MTSSGNKDEAVPDLIKNLLVKDYQDPFREPKESNKVSEATVEQRRKKRCTRGLCCAGWIICFPIFCLCWALRESPIDEEDLKDDDCYPCFN